MKNVIPWDADRKNGQPLGLYQRYVVSKKHEEEDGKTDPEAVYFILRLDAKGKDPKHARACQRAALTYAEGMRGHIPQLADELVRLVSRCAAELEMRSVVEEFYGVNNP